jgi:predicted RNA-binding protein with RPS1 domain
VHISELSHKYIQDARQAVKVGEIVKVKVIGVDATMKRISLSMKAIMPKPPRPPRRKKAKPAVAAPPQAASTAVPVEAPRKPKQERPPRKQPQAQQPIRPPKPPVETAPPPPKQTMEEKIRLLQEKFGRAR